MPSTGALVIAGVLFVKEPVTPLAAFVDVRTSVEPLEDAFTPFRVPAATAASIAAWTAAAVVSEPTVKVCSLPSVTVNLTRSPEVRFESDRDTKPATAEVAGTATVAVPAKRVPFFKAGKELKELLNQ